MSAALGDTLGRYAEAERLFAAGDYLALEGMLGPVPEQELWEEPELACFLAHAHSNTGRPAAALQLLEGVASHPNWLVSYRAQQRHRNALGIACFLLGRLEAAEAAWGELLSAAIDEGDHRQMGNAYNNLGIIAEIRSRWGEALTFYERAAAAHQRTGHRIGLGNAHHNRAVCYMEMDRYDKAESHIEQALTYLRVAGHGALVLAAEGVRAKIYFRRGDLRLAEAEAHRIAQQARITSMLWDEGHALELLGSICLAEERLPEARSYLDAALDRAVRSGIRFFEAEVLEEQMLLAMQGDDAADAWEKAEAASRIYRAMGATLRAERIMERLSPRPPQH